MQCARPMCEEEESRINGYCSVYCEDVDEARREIAHLKATLTVIRDVAYDRDGHTGDSVKLGELVDEIYGYARDALKESE